MYERIVTDEEFQNMMTEISSYHFTDDGKWDWEHGMSHALKVSRYVQHILRSLNEDEHIIKLGMIAGLLHDIGLITGVKRDHAQRSAVYARKYLQKYPMKKKDIDVIVQAIEDHSNGKNVESTVGAALLLADKIDVSNHRVKDSIVKDSINTEFAKMYRVDVEILGDDMCIFYKAEKDFNPTIFNYWIKALTIPKLVCEYLNKNCIFKINHQILDVESVVER